MPQAAAAVPAELPRCLETEGAAEARERGAGSRRRQRQERAGQPPSRLQPGRLGGPPESARVLRAAKAEAVLAECWPPECEIDCFDDAPKSDAMEGEQAQEEEQEEEQEQEQEQEQEEEQEKEQEPWLVYLVFGSSLLYTSPRRCAAV